MRGIGAEIGRSAGSRPFDYHFYVLQDSAINAFALPAGNIFVHTGLIAVADSEAELAALIRELGENHTILLSTHILSEVEMTCGRVIIINRGKLCAADKPDRSAC